MALKKGMDYFRQDGKKSPEIKSIMLSHGGQKAFGTICSLLQWAVDSNGYYLNWGDNDSRLAFCHEEMVGADYVTEIIKIATKKGIFDKERFEKYQILTNASLQEDFYNCAKRRKEIVVNLQYLVEPFVTLFQKLSENSNISKSNVNILEIRRVEQSNKQSLSNAGCLKRIEDYNEFKLNYPHKTDCSFEQIPDWVDIQKIKVGYDNSPWLDKGTNNLLLTHWFKKGFNNPDYMKIITGFYKKTPVEVITSQQTPTKPKQENSQNYVFKRIF